ncbi:MAG: hypothetical protein ABL901_14370 [Hyphomicrobiaceae bacterium]
MFKSHRQLMRHSIDWISALAIGMYVAAWAALSSPWLLGSLTIPYDAKAHFQAQLQFLSNSLHTGQSPFWTPNVFAGAPQIADPQSLIFSPALLIAIFNKAPSFTTVDTYVLALLGLGGLAIVMFVRDRGWHPTAGMVAGLMFAFGGSAAWRIQHIGQIKSYALFGIALWLLARALDRRSPKWGLAAGLAAGLMVVEPDQIALLGAYVLAAYVVAWLWHLQKPVTELRRIAPTLFVAGSVTLLVASLPVLMTYLFLHSSNRPQIAVAEALHGSLHPASLLTAVIGDLYGALDQAVPFWGPYSYSWHPTDTTLSENMSQVYSGALPILLLLTLGIIRGYSWHPDVRFFTVAFLFMLLYALGGFTPLFHVLYDYLPGVNLFRRPADATFLLGGLFSIVAAHLVHLVITGEIEPISKRQRTFEIGLFTVIFGAGLSIALWQGHFVHAVKPALIAIACVATAVLICAGLAKYGAKHAFAGLTAVTAFMTADLWINNGPNGSTALPVAYYEMMKPDSDNETIKFLKAKLKQSPVSNRRDRIEIVGLGFEWPNISLVHGFEQILGYNPLRLEDVTKAVGAGDNSADWHQRQFTPLFPSYRSLLADMLGVRYIVSGVPIERIDKKLRPGDLRLIARTKEAFIYENQRALPRVTFATNWQPADFDKLTASGNWPQFDPAQTVLLEEGPPMLQAEVMVASAKPSSSAVIERFENTLVDVTVEADRAGFLVMNGAWHPWWRATVDGQPAEILKANIMFNAVQVPAGRHKITFEFEPVTGALAELGRLWSEPSEDEEVVTPSQTTPLAVIR